MCKGLYTSMKTPLYANSNWLKTMIERHVAKGSWMLNSFIYTTINGVIVSFKERAPLLIRFIHSATLHL